MENFDIIIQQFLKIVNNQLANNAPPETRQTLERLQRLGYSELEAKMMIAQCVGRDLNSTITDEKSKQQERYIALLHQLPDMD